MDAKILAQYIVEANDKDRQEKTLEPVKASEFKEVVAEMVVEDGVKRTCHTIANIVNKKLADEVTNEDLTDVLVPYDAMYPLTEGPQFEKEGSPILYWIGDEGDGTLSLMRTKPTTQTYTMTFDSIYAYFEFNVDKLNAGVITDLNTQINKARNQFVGAANMLMWNGLRDGIGTSGANYATGGLTVAAMVAGISWCEDNSQQGAGALAGRRSTLTAMNNWNSSVSGTSAEDRGWFSDALKDEAWKNYLLAGFRGVPLLGIRKQKINVGPGKITHAGFSGIDAVPINQLILRPRENDFAFFAEQGQFLQWKHKARKIERYNIQWVDEWVW